MKFLRFYLTLVFFYSISTVANAQVNNGGFESGLANWTSTGAVEVLIPSDFAPAVGPFEGASFVLLSTGPDDNGGGDTGADIDGSGSNEFDAATLTQTFTAASSGMLNFTIAGFGSSEVDGGVDDIFEVRIDGVPVIQGSVPVTTGSPFADFGTLDGVDYTVTSGGATNGSQFVDGITAPQQFSFNVTAGVHTLEFFVADEGDDIFDSGLLIDAVSFVSNTPASIPTLSEWAMLMLILSLGFIGVRVSRQQK